MSGWIGAWGNAATVTNLTVTGSEIISVNTSTDALRITQTGTGSALRVEDSTSPDSTPFVIDGGGAVISGRLTQFSPLSGISAQVSVSANTSQVAISGSRNSDDSTGAQIAMSKSRGTETAQTIVANADSIGQIWWTGYDGANYLRAASIIGQIDATPGTNDMPGRLVFNTTADGASSPTERMRIDNAGNVYGTSGTTSMTGGFFYIPAAAGAPSGVPTAVSGRVPMYYDTTNNNFYVYNGAWKKVLLG